MQPAPERPLRNAQLARPLGVEPPQPGVLGQRVADGVGPVLGLEDHDVVFVALEPVARLHLHDLDRKLVRSMPTVSMPPEDPLRAPRAVEHHRRGAVLQAHGPEQAGDAEDVVGVIVGEEDLAEGEADPVPHHLPLGALAAVEEDRLAFALQRETGDVAVDGGTGGAGAEKGDGKHGGKMTARVPGPRRS